MGQTAARPSGTRPIVLILGGGYAGVTLAKLLDESGCCFVLLVDQKEFFLHTVGTPRALVAKHFAHRLLIPYDRLLKNGVVIHGVVQSITPREVTLHGRPAPIHFDFLCIATGAHYNFPYQLQQHFSPAASPSLPGHQHADNHLHPSSTSDGAPVAEHASSLPVPQPMFMMDTLSAFSVLFDAVQSARRVLVVGGGCVGVETAGELVARFGRDAARAKQAQTAKATAATVAAAATTPTAVQGTTPEAVAAPNSPATVAAPPVDAEFKHVTLLHSGATLLNRQTGMREKMREMLLAALKLKGVQVELLQRAQLDVLREVRADGTETARSKDVSRLLHTHGFLRAEPGCSLLVPAVNAVVAAAAAAAALADDASQAASQGAACASYATDLVVLATGLRHDGPSSALFRSDPEISTCLDARGRLVVNKFFQLDGQVCPERARASATRGAAAGSGASGERAGGPGSDSGLHTRFSFHYPRIFALGDCAVPRDELGQDLAPQAYLAHRHAQAVARNIQNMLSQCALVPYGGAGPLALFVSLGPEYGASQLPNRQSTLAGDVMTRGLKSADMQCAANWAFLNQDENKPSFKAHASQRFVEQQPRGVQSALPPQLPEDQTEATAAATAADQATSSEPHLVTADAGGVHDPHHRPHSPPSPRNPSNSSTTRNLASPSSPAYASVSSLSLHLHPQPVTSLSKPSLPAPTLLPDHHRTAAAPQPTIHAVLMHEQQKHVEEKLAAEAAEQQKHQQLHAVSQEQAMAAAHEKPASADVALPAPVACTSAASPHRPAGTESLSVAVRGASVVPSSSVNRVSSPCASSPIGPILLPGSESERQFEEAMASERDQLEEDEMPAGPLKTDTRDQELVLEETAASSSSTTAVTEPAASHSPAAANGHAHAVDSQSLDVHLQSFAQSNPFDDGEFAAEPTPTAAEVEAAATAALSAAGVASGHVHGAVAPAPILSPLPEGLEEESLVSPESARAVRPLGPSVEKYDGRAFLRFAKPNNAHDGQAGAVDDGEAEEDGSAHVQHASEDY